MKFLTGKFSLINGSAHIINLCANDDRLQFRFRSRFYDSLGVTSLLVFFHRISTEHRTNPILFYPLLKSAVDRKYN